MIDFKALVAKYLRDTADKLDADNTRLTESEAMDIMRVIAHESLSKEQACRHLNIRRSRFDDLVREGKIPKGRKVVGYTGLVWYKDELDIAVNK